MITTDRSTALTLSDQEIIGQVPVAIVRGHAVKTWWQQARQKPELLGRFPICRQIHSGWDSNYGFLHDAVLPEGILPVTGVIQDQVFDFPKVPAGMAGRDPRWVCDQAREFMMRYFMRLTYAGLPNLLPPAPAPFSRCGGGGSLSYGWGYEQWYYKLAGSGEVGKFPDSQRYRIIDLREIGPKYSWVVFKVDVFRLGFTLPPVSAGPQLNLPLPQPIYTVCTPDFVIQEKNPEKHVLGSYGFGFSVVPNPNTNTSLPAAPSKLTYAIETLRLYVLDTGEVRSHMDFIMPQPQQIAALRPVEWSFDIADFFTFGAASTLLAPIKRILVGLEPQVDPLFATFRLLNGLTLGVAAENYCLTKEQLLKLLLLVHFTDVFQMYNLAASHFRMVPDWTDEKSLPDWARYGTFTGTTDPHL